MLFVHKQCVVGDSNGDFPRRGGRERGSEEDCEGEKEFVADVQVVEGAPYCNGVMGCGGGQRRERAGYLCWREVGVSEGGPARQMENRWRGMVVKLVVVD